jgi:hypothetical protein
MLISKSTAGRVVAGVAAMMIVGGVTTAAAPAGSAVVRPATALLVQVQAAGGSAAPGNTSPADILVIVTDPVTGGATTNLVQSDFAVINHFSHPGQACGFSNNVVAFNNVGTGAYHLQVAPVGCAWASGDFLLQVIITSGVRKGQAAAKFTLLTRY